MKQLLIIGGGASGLTAALFAAEAGLSCTVLERTDRFGTKLSITGKGRCNLTNACDSAVFFEQIIRGDKFLRSALSGFTPKDTVAFFEKLGLPSHVERGDRVFPDCEDAKTVVRVLVDACRSRNVRLIRDAEVRSLILEPIPPDAEARHPVTRKVIGAELKDGRSFSADAVLLATGGKSYPRTGSDGSAFALPRSAGHTVTDLRPALVPISCRGRDCPDMMGLSLRNVTLRVKEDGRKKPVFEKQGELLFTHFGISGPLTLSASSHLSPEKTYALSLDWKPALPEEKLDRRILREIEENPARSLNHMLHTLLPSSAVPVFLRRLGLDGERRSDSLKKEERVRMRQLFKNFDLSYDGLRPVEEGIITAGGVRLSEIDPKTMASRKCAGLYFAGEMIDADALTGGFNLQIAFSTAFAAVRAIAQE